PSASKIIGTLAQLITSLTIIFESSLTPSPIPIEIACAVCKLDFSVLRLFREMNPFSSDSSGRNSDSNIPLDREDITCFGVARVQIPTPQRGAANVDRAAAPLMRTLPAMLSSRP